MKAQNEKGLNEIKCHWLTANFKSQNNHIQKVSNDFKNYRLVSKENLEKYSMLYFFVRIYRKKKASPKFIHFCLIAYILHRKTYQFLTDFLPLIPTSTCIKSLSPNRNFLKNCLTNLNGFDSIFTDNFRSLIPITLAGDAAAIRLIKNSNLNSIYIYMALPLSTKYKTTAIHLCLTKGGSSPIDIVKKFDDISFRLEILGYNVKYISSDGDQSFNRIHEQWFEKVDQVFKLNIILGENSNADKI